MGRNDSGIKMHPIDDDPLRWLRTELQQRPALIARLEEDPAFARQAAALIEEAAKPQSAIVRVGELVPYREGSAIVPEATTLSEMTAPALTLPQVFEKMRQIGVGQGWMHGSHVFTLRNIHNEEVIGLASSRGAYRVSCARCQEWVTSREAAAHFQIREPADEHQEQRDPSSENKRSFVDGTCIPFFYWLSRLARLPSTRCALVSESGQYLRRADTNNVHAAAFELCRVGIHKGHALFRALVDGFEKGTLLVHLTKI